jgi:hypothetical protein
MINLLKQLNYIPPDLKEEIWENVKIKFDGEYYYLSIDDMDWMSYNIKTHLEAYEVYSHYFLSEGHVTVTGLGFGVRENWILTKSKVKKLTIVEKSKTLIDYHRFKNSSFLNDERVEVINCDANEYTGSCDVLLLDHYECEEDDDILSSVKLIHDNVKCYNIWFWPFERIISNFRDKYILNNIPHVLNNISKYRAYKFLRQKWNLYKIPDIDEQEIELFCMMYQPKSYLYNINLSC